MQLSPGSLYLSVTLRQDYDNKLKMMAKEIFKNEIFYILRLLLTFKDFFSIFHLLWDPTIKQQPRQPASTTYLIFYLLSFAYYQPGVPSYLLKKLQTKKGIDISIGFVVSSPKVLNIVAKWNMYLLSLPFIFPLRHRVHWNVKAELHPGPVCFSKAILKDKHLHSLFLLPTLLRFGIRSNSRLNNINTIGEIQNCTFLNLFAMPESNELSTSCCVVLMQQHSHCLGSRLHPTPPTKTFLS